jgi:hypothetical protein
MSQTVKTSQNLRETLLPFAWRSPNPGFRPLNWSLYGEGFLKGQYRRTLNVSVAFQKVTIYNSDPTGR